MTTPPHPPIFLLEPVSTLNNGNIRNDRKVEGLTQSPMGCNGPSRSLPGLPRLPYFLDKQEGIYYQLVSVHPEIQPDPFPFSF
jgi:hypothetical protein